MLPWMSNQEKKMQAKWFYWNLMEHSSEGCHNIVSPQYSRKHSLLPGTCKSLYLYILNCIPEYRKLSQLTSQFKYTQKNFKQITKKSSYISVCSWNHMLWHNYIESGETIHKVASSWVKFKFSHGSRSVILPRLYEDDN